MPNWLEQAKHEISKCANSRAAVTDNRPLLAVMAVDKPREFEFDKASIGSNGSVMFEESGCFDGQHKISDDNAIKLHLPQDKGQESLNQHPWKAEEELWIEWFLSERNLPCHPFYLKQSVQVVSSEKFYISLRQDIDRGPFGPRNLFGALVDDLKCLKMLFPKTERSFNDY